MMNVKCPHCQKQLKLSEKFIASLESMKPGQKAKVKCTGCTLPFQIDKDLQVLENSQRQYINQPSAKKRSLKVAPPAAPDVTWLEDGTYEDREVVEEIPQALVLIPEGEGRDQVIAAVEGLGYRAEVVQSPEVAIEKMAFVNYSSVIMHTSFEPGGLQSGSFHEYMSSMNMTKRRYIFYAIIGEEFHTLYDLQALSYSANIVVNDAETLYFGTILRKAIPDYEALFGPLMEELRIFGK